MLRAHLPATRRVLEIASGAGEHAVAFAGALPGCDWHAERSVDAEARASIAAWREAAGLPNLRAPLALDVAGPGDMAGGPVEAVVCINMIHISPWAATEGLMARRGADAAPAACWSLYGPYQRGRCRDWRPRNAAFDESLKSRDPAWGLRDRGRRRARRPAAERLALTLRVAMPANNLMLLFRRT